MGPNKSRQLVVLIKAKIQYCIMVTYCGWYRWLALPSALLNLASLCLDVCVVRLNASTKHEVLYSILMATIYQLETKENKLITLTDVSTLIFHLYSYQYRMLISVLNIPS